MSLPRLSRRAALGAALLPLAAQAQPERYPSRPITLLVGFAPGGGTDIISRFLAPVLQEEFGQPVTVENRPGASGTIAATAITRARPDGYTMLMTTVSASAVVPPQMRPPPFDIYRDQTPVVLAGTVPLVAVVPPSSPARDLPGLLEIARAHPGKLNYSSSGVATQQHLAAELLSAAAGVRMTHIPFRGTGQAVNEVLAGRIDIAIDTLPTYLPHIRAGRVRALAVTLPARVEWLPEVPTVAELGFPGFSASVWYMVMGPPGLPEPIVARWVEAVNKALAVPEIRARVREAGFIPGGGTAADAAALLRRDAERYAAAIRDAGIRLD
ncbi:Bug family tripartite tricarboxylate transporter substrate binding protein [Caldovatus aquaticus]|uniref:Tripartite tricarboxylate transporter substrate binding protein n=1 Tax=Caldovatus aquaticus TaxID=2865671 RepID=A0ABS7F0V9_9PROT|nr:tripartite tricarboxylate transporter substrate binding protein [Caldovatus aquaticus]MBW8269153.1 tripartite tricarboxylate transporter substrate binding protein [Caldovatus aquaticus]